MQAGVMSRWRMLLIILTLIALGGIGMWWISRPAPVAVVLVTVERGLVESTVANTRAGTVKACRRAKLAPTMGGQIARLMVHEGDRVQGGQVLIELWNKDWSAQEWLAQEQLNSARARSTESCVQAEVAEHEVARARQLREGGFVSAERIDQAEGNAKSKRAVCNAARAAIEQAQAQIGVARAGLERTFIKAPFAGIVAKISGELGEYATPSPPGIPTPPAIDLIDDTCLYVTAPIDEVDAPAIRIGMPARITLDAFAGRHFPARIKRIAPYVLDIEKQARTVDVDVEFANPKEAQALLVGYSADVEVVLQARAGTLRIPTRALLEGNRVYVYRAATGDLEARQLKIGLSNWEYTEIESGLSAGERVVVSLEREGIKTGIHVTPEENSPHKKPGT